MNESKIEIINKFKIGDTVKFIDRTGAASEPLIVVDVDDENGRLTADRHENGRFRHSINAAIEHFFKA